MMQKRSNNTYVAVYAIILAFFTYHIVLSELQGHLTDYSGHVYTYIPLLQGAEGAGGWMAVPYFMWHLCVMLIEKFLPIPLEAAAAYTSCFFAIFSFCVLYWMFDRIVEYYKLDCSAMQKGFLAFALCIIQPVCMYWFDTTGQYLGQFSMSPMHNPTQMCVKPFSLLCLCFTYDILEKYHNPEHKGIFINVSSGLKKALIMLSVTLLLSCMAKPTFAEMFIPTVAFLMLYEWIRRIVQKDGTAKAYFHKCLTMLLASVPALAYILLQFLAYFIWGGSYGGEEGGLVITEWMQVWNMYSDNVAVSIVLGMGFPLFIVLINGTYFIKNMLGRLGLFGYIVGLLECALLGEGGGKITHGDFLWPMMSGMLLLWVVATLRLLILEQHQNKTKAQQLCIYAAWVIFYIFIMFGFIYMFDLMS